MLDTIGRLRKGGGEERAEALARSTDGEVGEGGFDGGRGGERAEELRRSTEARKESEALMTDDC
ncbi:hypothetical protein ACLOJK_021350 [Asimina triloba]